ncbi:MAG TPA: TIGR01777 family oxidoreductase [Myxococcales bacterium]|nr:TIGR01777 family oxidoreductase [Myxococcales bacterium]
MKVVIGGANGLIGSDLTRVLRARGDAVIALVRKPKDPAEVKWDGRTVPPGALQGADAAVNLSGASIAARRWSEAYKKEIVDSRVQTTRAFVEGMRAVRPRPRVFVNASAVGAYGGRGDEVLTEDSARGADFLAGVCKESEAEALRGEELGVRTVLLRTGVVLARQGGALKQMLPPFKAFVGGPIGTGRQWFPWIHLADEVGIILWALAGSVSGPVNAVSPNPVRMKDFAQALGASLHRPAVFSVPALVLRLGLGEMAEVLLEGQRAVPRKALSSGYQFRYGQLDAALRDLVASRPG